MKLGFYPRLAADGIRKNSRVYLPYILTCTGMVMMFYIILYLAVSDTLNGLYGAESLRQIFAMGSWVIAIFSAIFLFYTNSFLMRRRKHEFGLYGVLGMGKGNLARILFWETLQTAVLSLMAGLFCGILLSKLAELGLTHLVHGEVTFDLSLSGIGIKRTAETFGVIFVLLFLNSLRQVSFSSAVTLLKSESAGEKPPRGNLLLGGFGAVILAAAYYIAVSIRNPLSALVWFFIAVIMVIVATYILMTAGSVVFCRLLQKKKSYYYKPAHFVSVSSMVYRMKRNGAGLASICIMATMVLVIMASTTCLYFGEEETIERRYPRDININFRYASAGDLSDENVAGLNALVNDLLRESGVTPSNAIRTRTAFVSGVMTDSGVETDVRAINSLGPGVLGSLWTFVFMPVSDYNEVMGTDYVLSDGEALICTYRGSFTGDTVSFIGGETLRVAHRSDELPPDTNAAMDLASAMLLAVPDLKSAIGALAERVTDSGETFLNYRSIYYFDTGLSGEEQVAFYERFRHDVPNTYDLSVSFGVQSKTIESRQVERDDYYAVFGALFYLGIILSIVFLLATVLMIYYKQVTEGYEDQSRFEIMRKVGMTKREIRKSINSQLLTVFFLPLGFAVMHIVFAFPIIEKLLRLFNLNDVGLFARTTAVSAALFALFYTLVYKLTSNAYYNIVSGAKEE